MKVKTETLKQFYKRTKISVPKELQDDQTGPHFNLIHRSNEIAVAPYNRYEFYNICLVLGKGVRISNNRETHIERPTLFFTGPYMPFSYRAVTLDQSGFYCLFNESFISGILKAEIRAESPLFNNALPFGFTLNDEELLRISRYFREMESLLLSDYIFKYDMIRHTLLMLIHEGIRLQQTNTTKIVSFTDRLTSRFFRLLDQQFPIKSPSEPIALTTPFHFAERLNVHVNTLNSLVKRTTGKTTSKIIQERIISEAKFLLQTTDLNVAEIAYSLGFNYPGNFSKYFKQHTTIKPLLFREKLGLNII